MKTNVNIEETISQRFRLQSVQNNIFNNYKIISPTIDKIKRKEFLEKFLTWDENQQKKIIIELGGPANYKKTKYWINNLIKENNLIKQSNENSI